MNEINIERVLFMPTGETIVSANNGEPKPQVSDYFKEPSMQEIIDEISLEEWNSRTEGECDWCGRSDCLEKVMDESGELSWICNRCWNRCQDVCLR
jgi:hypothetical protein